MAEEPELKPIDSEEPDETPGYKPPAVKSLDEIKAMDEEDESLVKYKETLLAGVTAGPADDPRHVVVEQMALVMENRDDLIVDLTGDLTALKQLHLTVKEGTSYRIRITFKVQHEIVSGLKYHHVISRKGINADKQTYMVGSYGPKAESHTYLSPPEEAPKGMLYRGTYKIKSKFVDDDKNSILEWEWQMDIKKDWDQK